MALVSVTRLRLRSNRYLLPFMFDAISSSWQAKRAPGHLRSTTRRTENKTFWTLSVWESEADMRSYIRSGPHRKAMPKLQQWCDEASVVHWEQDGTKLPRWEEAEQMMRDPSELRGANRGRFTPLTHPSSAHLTKTLSV